jgi:hypothetical protein
MSTKQSLAALAMLSLVATASAAEAGVHRSHDAATTGYQGEAPPWSFACIKDSGPTQCREPVWIYGN